MAGGDEAEHALLRCSRFKHSTEPALGRLQTIGNLNTNDLNYLAANSKLEASPATIFCTAGCSRARIVRLAHSEFRKSCLNRDGLLI